MSQEERLIFWGGGVIVSAILCSKLYMYMCPILNGFRDRAISLYSTLFTVQYTVHCTDEQHAIPSRELQIALMLTVEFSKVYYTR
jgi:hypothetical protein